MKAAIYRRLGLASEVLEVVDIATPHPGTGEVRVRLAFSGVNPTDWKSRLLGPMPSWGEQIPNHDGSGVIDEVGEGVDRSRIGERVWVFHAARARFGGTAANYTCLPGEQAVRLPDHISLELGAGLGIPYITAHGALFGDGPINGKTILVTGGAGAVGHAAIEIASFFGARVISTVSNKEKAELASQAGASTVLNYRDVDFHEQLVTAAPEGVDRIIDVALGANLESSLLVLKPHGTIVGYASEPVDPVIPVRTLMVRNANISLILVYGFTPSQIASAKQDITIALNANAINPLPIHLFQLNDIARAHEAVESGIVGKVIVNVGE